VKSIATAAVSSGTLLTSREGWSDDRRRIFTWEDAYNRWQVSRLAMSEGGEALALEVTRPLSAGGPFFGGNWNLNLRGDLWLLNSDLENPRQMDVLAGGTWSSSFSPDGKRLSALTLIDPGRVGLVVWELDSGKHQLFSECNVEIFLSTIRTARSAYAAPTRFFQMPHRYIWLDNASILYVDCGDVRQQHLLAISSVSPTLQAFRKRTEQGQPSVREWSDDSPTCGAGSRLVRIACDTGKVETLYEGDVRGASLSADRRWLAVLVAGGNVPPVPDKPMKWPLQATVTNENPMVDLKLALVDLSHPSVVHEIRGVAGVGDVAPSRLPRWSDDNERVAVPVRATYSDEPSTGNDAVWEVTVSTGEARKWTTSSALDSELLAALLTTDGLNTKRVIDARPQNVRPENYSVAGQINGGAWRCGRQQVMFWDAPVLTIIAPTKSIVIPGNFSSVQPTVAGDSLARTISVTKDGRTSIITTAEDSYRIDDLQTKPEWSLLGVRLEDSAVVYNEDSDDGTFLIVARPGSQPRTSPLHFNTYFRDVLKPTRRMLDCSFSDGARNGLLVLPVSHKPGQRHPVIVWAYPDSIPSLNDSFTSLNNYIGLVYPVQYLLTRGFAFFQAPFPIGESSKKSNIQPMTAAASAVIPWLDVLDRQPEVLPGEYGFFGHSNAGYVALSLEALTRRFKAIVAWDTFPDLDFATLHSWAGDVALDCGGSVIQTNRMYYEDPDQPYVPQPAPPWTSPAKYIQNAPLFNLNRASTPLLLVEGEFDSDPREMEEVYSTLYGRGVPVELAYYWGEGHVFTSPGNIHNSWLRTERFLKKFLRMT
jgi:dipeptidyl aminopeptidase/acylaminoacyl peptidase